MKTLLIALTVALAAAPSYAQTSQSSPRVYANIAGGFAVAPENTSGDLLGEVGVRIAPNLSVFGNIGQFHNLMPSLVQPAVDATDTTLAAGGLDVNGVGRVPAWYSTGGLRYNLPLSTRLSPYVFGGLGFAHLSPTAQFSYASGTLLGATTAPSAGDDVTSQLVSLGDFTPPAASTEFMYSLGGGVEVPIVSHVAADVGYRLSHIAGDTPLHAQSVMFGVGYRF
jgi:opacity protein-like surface antigen